MKTTKDIEISYKEISQTAIDIIRKKFKKIWVVAEVQESVSSTGLYYQYSYDDYYSVTVGTEKLDALMYQLFNRIQRAGHEPFTTAEFSLDSDGHFDINYTYDPEMDFSFQYERMLEWERSHFGPDVRLKYVD